MDLRIKNNNATKSYVITNNCTTRPRVCMKSDTGVSATPISYLPLTTSTTQGLALRAKVNDQSYRALEFRSMSGSATFHTSGANSAGMSNTTALTRVSTSRTEYLTRSSTSATSYLTRSSTSGESYLTQLNSMLLIRQNYSSTYMTRGTWSARTDINETAIGYAATSVFPEWAYSVTNNTMYPSGGSASIQYPTQDSGYSFTQTTGPQSGQMQATLKFIAYFYQSFYIRAYYTYQSTDYWQINSQSYTNVATTNSPYKTDSVITTSSRGTNLKRSETQVGFYFIATTAITSNTNYIYSLILRNIFSTDVGNKMINYSSNSAFSTTFSNTVYTTVNWGDGRYYMETGTSILSFGHATKTTGTSYLTRSSTYDTIYHTRSSTYSTVYHTRSSTSGYSGVSSSSSETSGWQ